MSRHRRIAALSTALLAGCVLAGGVGAASAQADSWDNHHYVAFLRTDDRTNSVLLVNNDTDGGARCVQTGGLTREGGAQTTTYVVTNETDVEYYKYTSDNCTYSTNYFSSEFEPRDDSHKYWYVAI